MAVLAHLHQCYSAFHADFVKYCTLEFGTTSASLWQLGRMCLSEFGLHCVWVYRWGQCARGLWEISFLLGLLPMLAWGIANYLMRLVHHVRISAEIGPGFYIGHVGEIHIGARSIGKNFSVTHNVTIGAGMASEKTGNPTIGDNVWVGTGAVIYGEVAIGNNVTIAPGCVVSNDVPDGFLVAGNPGRPVRKDYDNTRLFGKVTPAQPQPEPSGPVPPREDSKPS